MTVYIASIYLPTCLSLKTWLTLFLRLSFLSSTCLLYLRLTFKALAQLLHSSGLFLLTPHLPPLQTPKKCYLPPLFVTCLGIYNHEFWMLYLLTVFTQAVLWSSCLPFPSQQLPWQIVAFLALAHMSVHSALQEIMSSFCLHYDPAKTNLLYMEISLNLKSPPEIMKYIRSSSAFCQQT